MFNFHKKPTVLAIDKAAETRTNGIITGDAVKALVHEFTLDVVDLERRIRQFLFVPNEWMKRHPQHELLGGALMIGDVFTQERFSVWRRRLGEASSIIPIKQGFNSVPRATIRGELYLVPTQKLFQLDRDQKNGVYFKRERIKVNLPYSQQQLEYGPNGYFPNQKRCILQGLNAWMYVGVNDYWNSLFDAGFSYKPVSLFKPNNPLLELYYYHTIEDYDKHT